jgi:hypothetical protein
VERVREYVGTMDEGIGEADFLDELIPVEGWQQGGNTSPADSRKTDARAQA